MKAETFEPFLEWIKKEKGLMMYHFIKARILRADIAGIWGYLIEFFEDFEIRIGHGYNYVTGHHFKDKFRITVYSEHSIWFSDSFSFLAVAQIEATESAFKLLTKKQK